MLHSRDDYLHAKKLKIYWFFPVLLLITESFNLIQCETQQTTSNQKMVVPGATFPWQLFLYKIKLRSLYSFIDDQRILHSDGIKDTTGHTQPKMVVFDATFFWWLSLFKKSKRLLDSVQRNWWLKNTALLLAKSILGHNRRTRFSLDIRFLQNHQEHCYATFLGKKDIGLNFWQKPKHTILEESLPRQKEKKKKENISEKLGCVSFGPLRPSNLKEFKDWWQERKKEMENRSLEGNNPLQSSHTREGKSAWTLINFHAKSLAFKGTQLSR